MTDVSATTLPTNPTPMNVPIRRRAVQPVPVAAAVEPEIERVAEFAEVADDAERPSQHMSLLESAENAAEDETVVEPIDLSPRRRGRPKGSKNVTAKASEPAVGRVKREPRVAKPNARRAPRAPRAVSDQHDQLAILGGLFIEATKQGISTNELIENMRATVAAFDALTKSE